jgi:hypothetical protein
LQWWLLTLTDMLHGSLFGNFLENSDKQRIEKDQAGTTESIWSFLFDTRYRDQFRSGMYMPSYYDNTSEREGLLGNGILCPKSDLKDVFIWRDYFLRWVEDPLRGCPPALRRDQRQLLAKLKRNAAQGKPDEDAPKWPDIYDDVPAPERVSSPHPAELTSPPPVSQTEPEPDMVMVEEPDMEEDERTETAAAAAAAAAAAGQEEAEQASEPEPEVEPEVEPEPEPQPEPEQAPEPAPELEPEPEAETSTSQAESQEVDAPPVDSADAVAAAAAAPSAADALGPPTPVAEEGIPEVEGDVKIE